jgi:hypothetical protein
MGNIQTINKISYEDMKYCIQNNVLIISVIKKEDENCLIKNTTTSFEEENIINDLYNKKTLSTIIIMYGYNCNDNNIVKKYKQLLELGFNNIYVYMGGLFEWLLLQDIYGKENFETTSKELNHLKYKPISILKN